MRRRVRQAIVRRVCVVAAASGWIAWGGSESTGPTGNPDANLRVTVAVSGSGGVGNGLEVRVGERRVTVAPGAPGELELAAGSYEVEVESPPEWCEVDPAETTVTAPATGSRTVALSADCVGGVVYETTPSSVHSVRLRTITPEGFAIQFTDLREGRHTVEGWSPDGRQVAVATGFFSDPPRLRLWDVENERFDDLPFDGTLGHYEIAWSPDSERIAYTLGHPSSQGRLMTAPRSGSGPIPLLAGPDIDATPAWSPDGGKIAFATFRTRSNRTLHVVNADGTGLVELGDRWAEAVSWSPDGQWIGYLREDFVTVIRADGSGRVLIEETMFSVVPQWSPSRNEIGWEFQGAIEVYEVDSDVRRTVVDLDEEIRGWSWSSNGEWIVFAIIRFSAPSELRIVRRDGTDMRTILTSADHIRGVTWDPTARH